MANEEDSEMSSGTVHSGVVVGVDGSTPSLTAVRWAAHEAAMRNVPLTIVHALCETVVSSAANGWSADPELWLEQEDEARNMIADAVKTAEDSLESRKAPQVSTELLYSPPVPTLVDQSQEAQMVVVGCRGQGALRRILLGSVSTGLVHHAHCPVAVIHDEAPTSQQPSELPVLVGIDGSQLSELAAAVAFDEASWRGVELAACMHGVTPEGSPFPTRSGWACNPAPRKPCPSASRAFKNAIPMCRCGVKSCAVIRHVISSTSLRRPNSWLSAAMAAAASPGCWDLSARRWSTGRAHP
jgi:nucleotide-binding universal stress UspA family protein